MRQDILASILICFSAYFLGTIPKEVPMAKQTVSAPLKKLTEINYEKLQAAIKNKSDIIIDVRNPDAYKKGHIASAKNIPRSQIEANPTYWATTLNTNSIIIYCSNRDCPDSKASAEILLANGLEKIKYYPDGWDEWKLLEPQP